MGTTAILCSDWPPTYKNKWKKKKAVSLFNVTLELTIIFQMLLHWDRLLLTSLVKMWYIKVLLCLEYSFILDLENREDIYIAFPLTDGKI